MTKKSTGNSSMFMKACCTFCIMLIGICWLQVAYAQIQAPTFVPVAPETLTSSFVRCIKKDSRGFMWLGTGNGLIRYDGTNAYRYEHVLNDNTSLPNNRINAIMEDRSKNLWIASSQGVVIYNREENNFINVDSIARNTNHLTNKYITSLSMDAQGKIWMGTMGHGINVYNPETFTFSYLAESSFNAIIPPSNYVTSLFQVDGTMWVGTKGGTKIFDTETLRSIPLPVTDKSVTSKEINQVVGDRSKRIWIATSDREIIRLAPESENYQVEKTRLAQNHDGAGGGNILTLCLDPSGNLWIGGENSGLCYLETKTLRITYFEAEFGNPKRLPTNSVRCVYVDDTGITWIGTHNKGAFLIDNHAKKFDAYQRNVFLEKGLTGNSVKGLAEDRDGNIWIACDGGGLARLDVRSRELWQDETINKQLGTRYLSALLYDSQGNLWIGTWGRGVYKANLKTQKIINYKLQSGGFGDNKVFCLYEDKKKRIWAGTVGSGLFYLDASASQFTSLNEEKKADYIKNTNYVTSIHEAADSTLWVGTLFGLFNLRNEHNNSYDYIRYIKNDQPGSIGSNDIYTIQEDAKGNLLVGTDNGLSILLRHHSTFKNVQKQDGLRSNSIYGVLIDGQDNMWLSGNMGLAKYITSTKAFRNYTREDGLPSNEFNGNTCLRAHDGKFYFGTDNGLVAFHPDSIRDNTRKPIVYLTDLKLNNQSVRIGAEGSPLQKHISFTDHLELSYNQRSFAIDFVAINYGQASRDQYCYKLEGFDDDWNCVGSETRATYTNIDPGSYVFLVKASNSDGITSIAPARLEISIQQAPWKSWWAILLYIIIAISILYFLIRIRVERIKMKSQLELERLAREKEHELSESKTQFFTDISHELRTPLSLIAMPLENLMSTADLPSTVKERLGTIRTSADKMMRLVNELMDFNKMEKAKLKLVVQQGELIQFISEIAGIFTDVAEKRNIHFGIHPMVRTLNGWFDHDKLEKILVNVLSNAFKFTADKGTINIIINAKDSPGVNTHSQHRNLELVIIDNGIGVAPEELPFIFDKFYQAKSATKIANPGTGIGLALTKGLVELHGGSIHVESTPDYETKFVIYIPIDRQAYNNADIVEIQGLTESVQGMMPVLMDDLVLKNTEHDDPDKPLILVVEDNDELRTYVSLELRNQFNILEAKDGEQGLALAFERSPDLIISDVMMPLKTGMEMCQEIKANLKTSHIPLVLLTAKTTVEDQIEGLAKGADVYITKPFSIRFLFAQVNQIIESRKKLYSRFSQDVYLLPNKVASNEIDQAFLQKAIDYIIDNIQDPQLGVDSIADLFNLSRMQVYRKIKALTGKSVVDFIRMVRIKQALKLMDTHKYTLSEIAFQTGFNSSSYFTKCFKDQYGKAPSEYLEAKA